MATLQKFKLMATQCGVPGNSTQSPTSSPVIQLPRRKSLRMLLRCHSGRRSPPQQDQHEGLRIIAHQPEKKKKDIVGHSLKDLFLSSPLFEDDSKVMTEKIRGRAPSVLNDRHGGGGPAGPLGGLGSPGPVWAGFRYRSLRRAWRPVLSTIPEECEK